MSNSSNSDQELIFENWRAFSKKEYLTEAPYIPTAPLGLGPRAMTDTADVIAGKRSFKETATWYIDQLQNVLMVVGFLDWGPLIPVAMAADLINAIIYALRGMWIDFVISVICIIPWIGVIGGAAKVGSLSGRASKIAFGVEVLTESGVLKSADELMEGGNKLLRSLLKRVDDLDLSEPQRKALRAATEWAIKSWEDVARPIIVMLLAAAGIGTAVVATTRSTSRTARGDRGDWGRYHVIISGETPRQTIERYFPQLESEQEKVDMLNRIIALNGGLMPGQYSVGQDIMLSRTRTVESP
jgi:hypothetical protein